MPPRIGGVIAAQSIRTMCDRLLFLGPRADGHASASRRQNPCARHTDCWRLAVISLISAHYGCSCSRESADIYLSPSPDKVPRDSMSFVDSPLPRLPSRSGGIFRALAIRTMCSRLLSLVASRGSSCRRETADIYIPPPYELLARGLYFYGRAALWVSLQPI